MNRTLMFLGILAIVGTFEFLVMVALPFLGLQEGMLKNVVDAGLLILISAPVIHRWVVRAEEALQEREKHYRNFLDNASDLIQSVTPEGRFRYVNRVWRETLGYREDEIPNLSAWDVIHPNHREEFTARLQRALQGESISNLETVFVTKDGRNITVSGSANCRFEGTKPVATRSIFRNITESKRAAKALEETNQKLVRWGSELEKHSREADLLNEMAELLSTALTFEEAYRIISGFAQRLFPAQSGAVYVLSPSRNLVETVAVWGGTLVGERVFAPEHCWALRRGRTHRVSGPRPELHCHHLGQTVPARYLCIPMMAQGEALGIFHLQESSESQNPFEGNPPDRGEALERLAVAAAEHIGLALANLNLREKLRNQSIRDPLTGLFNRRYMEVSLERELHRATRKQRPLGVIMVDLDHFKHFNDTYGHQTGDALLRTFGQFLQKRMREEDLACRYGGEEFILIFPEAELKPLQQRAEELRETAKQIRALDSDKSSEEITLSLGVASFPEHGSTVETLLQAVDAALYRAKAEGRDRVVLAQP